MENRKITEKSRHIYDLVMEHDGEYTAKEIAEILHLSPRSITATINASFTNHHVTDETTGDRELKPVMERVEHTIVNADGKKETIKLIYMTEYGKSQDYRDEVDY